ncbi:MAG: SdiA-regulated domain-containing protein [Chitinophagaceae bacterium]
MKYIVGIALLLAAAGFFFRKDIGRYLVAGQTAMVQQDGKGNDKNKEAVLSIVDKWELPEILREVSGIAWMDEKRFACIQDEDGIIFIYNHADEKIEKEIPFAGPGDYEGITLNGDTAYVVRADGHLYQVPLNKGKKGVKELPTPLTVAHNVEGLFYDKDNNRLLLAIKDDEPGNKDYKGIYAFDLSGSGFNEIPVFKISNNEDIVQKEGKKKGVLRPSAIAIHPQSKALYVVDGPGARLLQMQNGKAENVYRLGKDFPQAEGIAFSPEGDMFISSEGKKRGVIVQVALP